LATRSKSCLETGKTTDDLTAGFYDLVSAGVPAGEAIGVLKDSAILATGSLGTTAEAVDLVTSTMGAYGLSAKESTKITDIWAQAVADGKTTVSDLASGISQVAPIAAATGISMEELAANAAVMTLKGDSASQAFTRVKAAISALVTPNKTLLDIQERTGIQFAKLADEKGLAVALEELRKATNGNNEEFAKALGSSEALTLAFSTTGENADAVAEELRKVGLGAEEGGVALGQYTEKSKSSVEQGKRFAAVLNTLAQDFGGVFAGAAPFLMTMNALGPAFRGVVSPAKLLGGVLGGVLGNSFKLLAKLPIPTGPLRKLGEKLTGTVASGMASTAASNAIATGVGDAVADGVSGAAKGSRLGRLKGAAAKIALAIVKPIGIALAASAAGASIIGDGIATMFGKIPGNTKITGALSKVGQLLGNRFAQAFLAGVAFVGIAIEIRNHLTGEFEKIKPEFDAAGADAAEALTNGTLEELKASEAKLAAEYSRLARQPATMLGEGGQKSLEVLRQQLFKMRGQIAEWEATGNVLGNATVDGATSAIEYGTNEVEASTRLMATLGVKGAEADVQAAAAEVGGAVPTGIGEGILAEQGQIDTAMGTLRNLIENERTPAKQAAHVIGQLISKEVSNGVVSGRAGVKDAARSLRESGEAELRAFIAGGGKIGRKSMDALRQGMKDKDPEVRNQSKRTLDIIKTETDKLKGVGNKAGKDAGTGITSGINATKGSIRGAASGVRTVVRGQFPDKSDGRGWGKGLGTAYGDGIKSSTSWIQQAARNALLAAKHILATHSPPGPQSPLHDIDKWGAATMVAYADGLEKGGVAAQSVLQRVLATNPGIAVPITASGVIDGSVAFQQTMAARHGQQPINVATYGLPMKAETPAQVVRRIRRASRLGTVSPKPVPGVWEQT
jgi:TP901 family phage tail tape measure protein